MLKCPYCNQEFKRITPKHLEKHGVTWKEYLKEHRKEDFENKTIIDFFNDFYISVRYRYLLYTSTKTSTVTVTNPKKLNDDDILAIAYGEKDIIKPLTNKELAGHLKHYMTIGIYFPTHYSNVISFDIDKFDTRIIQKVYGAIVEYVPEESILCSYSGNKGFHIDLFLVEMLDKTIINEFYKLILSKTKLSEKIVELRGGNGQGVKLPLGINFKNHDGMNNFCYLTDYRGIRVDTIPELQSKKKCSINCIIAAVKENIDVIHKKALTDEQIEEFEEMQGTTKLLEKYDNTNEKRAEKAKEYFEKGIHAEGLRHNVMYEIAIWLKSEDYCMKDVIVKLNEWILRCSNYGTNIKEFKQDIKDTVKTIFKKDYKFDIQAKEIKISLQDIREVFTVETKNKLETKALRKLYYILLLHSRAYAGEDGIFYMSREQMSDAGAGNKAELIEITKKINKLIKMGKLLKFKADTLKAPNRYKLIELADIVVKSGEKTFKICNDEKCKDCLYKATCYLTTDKERRKYIKGKEFKMLELCPYNKDSQN